MQTQIFLIAPDNTETAPFLARLKAVLEAHEVSALLLPRGSRAENAYKDFAKKVIPVAQDAGVAVLLEGSPGLVKMLNADGLHITGADVEAAREAVEALRPKMIVGVGDVTTRDAAMSLGELEVDYILFGPLSGPTKPAAREMARWWAETMEIPSVLSDPEATFEAFDAEGCEFIGLGMPAVVTAQ
ncbi:MAG TPA: thiamine phosphate synthase [Devosia sp.]